LKSDRERQEQLAKERLAARRNRKKSSKDDDPVDPIEPEKGRENARNCIRN